jgi:hypothetical protein
MVIIQGEGIVGRSLRVYRSNVSPLGDVIEMKEFFAGRRVIRAGRILHIIWD